MRVKLVNLKKFEDQRGSLVTVEGSRDIPFEVKRIYYIYGNRSDLRRGFHAHKKLQQLLICVNGSCKIHIDNGFETAEIMLDNPAEGLFLENNIWREMYDFSDNAVLLVLASEYYDESDYIRNYDEFIKFIKN